MEFEKTWPVEMYSKLVDNKWIEPPPDKGSVCLLIKGSQLMVVRKSMAVETICLLGGGGSTQVHYSNQSMGISVVLNKNAKTKFKIRFMHCNGTTAEDNCLEVVNVLSKFVSVTEHPSHTGRKPAELISKTMTQVMKDILERNPELLKTSDETSKCNMCKRYNCQYLVRFEEESSGRGEKVRVCGALAGFYLSKLPRLRLILELILPEKNIAELVQGCLLDPGFPALVAKVEDLLENGSGDIV